MSDLFCIESGLTEEEFENMTRGRGLSEEEREFLRRYYGLPYNFDLVSRLGTFGNFVIMAQQKIRGNPMLQAR